MTMGLTRRPFTILSPIGPDEAGSRLSAAIGSVRPVRGMAGTPFRGRISAGSFDMMTNSTGRNSLRPRIRGTIEADPAGSRISGTMQIHEAVLVFLGLFIAIPGWLFLSALPLGPDSGSWDVSLLALPAGIVFLIGMMGLAFVYESRRALKVLATIVDGRPMSPDGDLASRGGR